jgi:hypothetical protein
VAKNISDASTSGTIEIFEPNKLYHYDDVAQGYGVCSMTVKRWLKKAGAEIVELSPHSHRVSGRTANALQQRKILRSNIA